VNLYCTALARIGRWPDRKTRPFRNLSATQPADIRRGRALFAEYKVRKAELNLSKTAFEEAPPWR
jgi:hypothetical protein